MMRRWLLACLLWLGGCATLTTGLESPHAALVDLRPKAFGLFQQEFDVDLRLTNPNNVDLALQGISLDIQIDEIHFAHLVSDEAIRLPRLGSTRITLQATTQLGDWLRQLRRLEGPSHKDLRHRVHGSLYVGNTGLRLPVDEGGSIDLEGLLRRPASPPAKPQDSTT